MRKAVRFLFLLFFVCLLPAMAVARNYYVSPSGDDSAAGTQEQPWRTLGRVSQADLDPGDRVLLEGGKVFPGALLLDAADSGTPGQAVLLMSHGMGRATIDAGDGVAIQVEGSSNVVLRDLNCVGSGRKTGNTQSGIFLSGVTNVQIDQVDVSGFRHSGIRMSGVTDVRITRVHAFQNGFAGISSSDEMSKNIYVGYCLAENNPGDPTILNNHSGNGIVIGKVSKALIEYCEARYNGWDMPRKGNGPVGIWTWHADQVVIQFCVSHHNRSTGVDGGGFDFDGGVTNSILQYNYSHDNHGSGYLICQYYGAAPFRGNTVRYNISQDDGLTNHNAGIYVWVGGAGMESTDCYNNTIFNSKGAAVGFGVDRRFANQLPKMTFRNNIFVSGEAQIEGGAEKGQFQGNIYWAMGDGGFLVDGYTSFDAWVAATGQEKIDGKVVGKYADPLLQKNGTGLLTDPTKLPGLPEYLLLPGSPAIDAGLDLKQLFGLDPGGRDFYGNALPAGKLFDIGAHEYSQPSGVAPPRHFTIQDVAWIRGCWQGGDAASPFSEQWTAPDGGTMLGVSRTVKNGKTVAYEFILIRENEAGEVHYVAKPSGQAEASFRLVRAGDREAVFENPEHDFPQRIIYRLKEDDSLHARIEGVSKGQLKAVDFPLKKVPCE